MKAINKILSSLFFMCLFLGYTACIEQLEYTPADVPGNAQVYFSNTLPSKVALSQDFNVKSYDVELLRINKTDALTVNLVVENGAPGIFTVPTSVSFAAGSEITKITINYDPSKLDYDEFNSFRIAVSDESVTSVYGNTSYSFTAGIPAPWTSLGKASFNVDDFMQGGPWEVEIQQHDLDPTRYRLVAPFAGRRQLYSNVILNNNPEPYLEFAILPKGTSYTTFNRESGTKTFTSTFDGLVIFEPAAMGVSYVPTGADPLAMAIWHPAARTPTSDDMETWVKNTVIQWSKDGKPEIVQLAPWFVQLPAGAGWNETQSDGMITIIFPGVVLSDYSIEVNYLGRFTDLADEDYVTGYVTLGEDVALAKVAMVAAKDAATAVEDIIDGSLESIEIEASGRVEFPCLETGNYTIVAVSYSAEGEAKESASTTFKFTSSHDNAETWKSIGIATYTDVIFSLIWNGVDPIAYEVEIQESEQNRGKFRLVNPYGEAYPYNEPGDWDDSKDYFMEINAMDPDGVYIEQQDMGIDWGYGNFSIYSRAAIFLAAGNSLEDIKAAGYCGTYQDGIISFPANILVWSMAGYNNGTLYLGREGAVFEVVMPDGFKSATAKPAQRIKKSSRVITSNFEKPLLLKKNVDNF